MTGWLERGRRCIAVALCLAACHGAGVRAAAEDAVAVPSGTLGLSIGINSIRGLDASALSETFRGYAATGTRWVRVDLDWSVIQAAGPESYDWSEMDAYVALANELGLRLLPVVSFAPRWLDGGVAPANAGAIAAYTDFLRAAIARYQPRGIRSWEIWNEPNLAGFWAPTPDPAAYTRLLIAAYAAVKAADPGAIVISGGLSPAPGTGPAGGPVVYFAAVDFLTKVYEAGGGGGFDALGFHPYSWPRMPDTWLPWSGWSMMEGPIRSLMTENGDGAKQIWLTEYGAPTGGEGVSEADQAEMLARAVSLARNAPWAGPIFWYSYQDLGTNPGESEDWFGLLRHDGNPKPAFFTFQKQARSGQD